MKKYIGLALVTFFGTAAISMLVAPRGGSSGVTSTASNQNHVYGSTGYHAYAAATPPSGTGG